MIFSYLNKNIYYNPKNKRKRIIAKLRKEYVLINSALYLELTPKQGRSFLDIVTKELKNG